MSDYQKLKPIIFIKYGSHIDPPEGEYYIEEEYSGHWCFCICDRFTISSESITPPKLKQILEMGYGAIINSQSPTGYVDLFGDPCLTI